MNKQRLVRVAMAVCLITLIILSFPGRVFAGDSGTSIAISGTFYRQHFKLMPGESLQTPDIYVVVFNQGQEEVAVKLVPVAPTGVQILLAKTSFRIPAGKEAKVNVGVKVDQEAVPGNYLVVITAEIQHSSSGEGITITGAAQQQAKLTVLGEAGEVRIKTILPNKELFPSEIRLYQKENGQLLPFGYSDTGELKTRVPVGEYMVQAFYKEKEVAKEEFKIADNEEKELILTAHTVFIYGFAAVPVYGEDQKTIVSAKITYNIENIYRPLKNVKTSLVVNFAGHPLEEAGVLTLPTLDTGVTGGSYQYSPPAGWQNGLYDFKMAVYSDNLLYGESPVKELTVTIAKAGALSPLMIAIIVGAVVLIVLLIFILMRRRRD